MNKMRIRFPAVLVALFVVGVPALVLGYTLTGTSFTTPTRGFWVNPNFVDAAAGDAAAQIDAIRKAADEWRITGMSGFAFTYEGTTTVSSVAADGINAVFYSDTDGNGALAVCYYWSISGVTTNFDIEYFDRDGGYDFVWAQNPTYSQFDIQSVGTHEFGHALGLGHSGVSGATMYPTVAPGSTANRSLSADDIAGVQVIYGAAAPLVPSVTSVSPPSAWVDGGTPIVITGGDFPSQGVAVRIGGQPATGVTWSNHDRLSCFLPTGTVAGSVDVEVDVSGTVGTLAGGFAYQNCRVTGPLQFGSLNWVEARIPGDAGLPYLACVGTGTLGIPLAILGDPSDLRWIPMTWDFVWYYAVTDGYLLDLPYFENMHGLMDVTGTASFGFTLPEYPELHGIPFYFCLLTGDLAAQSGVRSITNACSASFVP